MFYAKNKIMMYIPFSMELALPCFRIHVLPPLKRLFCFFFLDLVQSVRENRKRLLQHGRKSVLKHVYPGTVSNGILDTLVV